MLWAPRGARRSGGLFGVVAGDGRESDSAEEYEVRAAVFSAACCAVQPAVLPVARAQEERAHEVVRRALARGLRAEVSGPGDGTLGARIRAARLVPYQAVIGDREADAGLAAVRLRDGRRPGAVPVAELLDRIAARAADRGAELWSAA